MSFFGAETGVVENLDLSPATSDIPSRRQLSWEKELLGVYVSDHPLTPFIEDLSNLVSHYSAELHEAEHGQRVCVAGELSHIRPYQTKTGKAMGFATLEDLQGTIELVIFSRVWGDVSPWLEIDTILVVEGRIDSERGEPKVLVDKMKTQFNEVKSTEPPPQVDNFKQVDPPDSFAILEDQDYIEQPVSLSAEISQEDVVAPAVDIKNANMPEKVSSVVSATVDEEGLPPVEVLPIPDILRSDPTEAQMITINLETTGDQQRDALRMRRVHGLFTSYPGSDRFAFQLFEASRRYLIEFPSHSTGYCADLHAQLVALLGEGAIRVELLRIQ